MALPTPTQTATGVSSGAATTCAATLGAGSTSGNLLVAIIGSAGYDTHHQPGPPSSVTDNKGNTWTQIDTANNQASVIYFDGGTVVAQGSAYYCANAIAGTTVVTANGLIGDTNNKNVIVLAEYPLTGASPLDKHVMLADNGSSPADCGNTANTTQASELVVGWVVLSDTSTPTVTSPTPANNPTSRLNSTIIVELSDKTVSSTGPQTANYTVSSTGVAQLWICGVMSFKIPNNVAGTCAVKFVNKGISLRTGKGTCAVKFGGSSGTLLVTRRAKGTDAVVIAGSSGTLLVTRRATGTGAVVIAGSGTPTAIRQKGGVCHLEFVDIARAVPPGHGRCDLRFGARGANNVVRSAQGHLNLKFVNTGSSQVTHIKAATCVLKFKNTGARTLIHNAKGKCNLKFKGVPKKAQAIRQRTGKAQIKFAGKGTRDPVTHKAPKGIATLKFTATGTNKKVTRGSKGIAKCALVFDGGNSFANGQHKASGELDLQFDGTSGLTKVTHTGVLAVLTLQFDGTATPSISHVCPGATCRVAFGGNATPLVNYYTITFWHSTGVGTIVRFAPIAATNLKFGGRGTGKPTRQPKGTSNLKFKATGRGGAQRLGHLNPAILKFGGFGAGHVIRTVTDSLLELEFDNSGVGSIIHYLYSQGINLEFGGDGSTGQAIHVLSSDYNARTDLVFDPQFPDGSAIVIHIMYPTNADVVFDMPDTAQSGVILRSGAGELDLVFQGSSIFPTVIRQGTGELDLFILGTGFAPGVGKGTANVKFGGYGTPFGFGSGTARLKFTGSANGNSVYYRSGTASLAFVNTGAALRTGSGTASLAFGKGATSVRVTRIAPISAANVKFVNTGTGQHVWGVYTQANVQFGASGTGFVVHIPFPSTLHVAFGGTATVAGPQRAQCDLSFSASGTGTTVKSGTGTANVVFSGSASSIFLLAPGVCYIQFQGNGTCSATRIASGTCRTSFGGNGLAYPPVFGSCGIQFGGSGYFTHSAQGRCNVQFGISVAGLATRIAPISAANVSFFFGPPSSTAYRVTIQVFIQTGSYPNTDHTQGLWVIKEKIANLLYVATDQGTIFNNILPVGATAIDRGNGFFPLQGFNADQWYQDWIDRSVVTGRNRAILSAPVK